MDPLAEPNAVALLLQHPSGWVLVYGDGSSRWGNDPPAASIFWDPADVPEPIPCAPRSYQQARTAFAHALKRLRNRGVHVG